MADLKNSVTMTLGYSNTDFQRKLKFDGVADSLIPAVKTKIKAVNASLAGGTDGGLSNFFVADDYDATDPDNVVGKFNGITAAQIDSVEVTYIDLNEEG